MSSLKERLEALKNKKESPAEETPKENVPSKPSVSDKLAALRDKTSTLKTAASSSVKVVEEEKVDILEAKRLVEDIGALELSAEAKSIEGFNHEKFHDTLLTLNSDIERSFPEVKTALIDINRDLRQHPELAHLLSDEQIAVVVQRVLQQRNIEIAPAKKTKKPSTKVNVSKEAENLLASLSSDGVSGGLNLDDL